MTEFADQTRCIRWPQSCAEIQAQTATAFQFCDFCFYGPPEPPHRDDSDAIGLAEAVERIRTTEQQRGEKLREAVISIVNPDSNTHEEVEDD